MRKELSHIISFSGSAFAVIGAVLFFLLDKTVYAWVFVVLALLLGILGALAS